MNIIGGVIILSGASILGIRNKYYENMQRDKGIENANVCYNILTGYAAAEIITGLGIIALNNKDKEDKKRKLTEF